MILKFLKVYSLISRSKLYKAKQTKETSDVLEKITGRARKWRRSNSFCLQQLLYVSACF